MRGQSKLGRQWFVGLTLVTIAIASAVLFLPRLVLGSESVNTMIARGGGTTIIHGGTGPTGGFVPVLTTIAFHAEKSGSSVTGSFECLALAPEASTGSTSAQFTKNAMYVTGQINGASVNGDTATLTGTSDVTGLGAGLDLPFTFVVQRGGPGATSDLTVNGLTFHEILVTGSFQVQGEN